MKTNQIEIEVESKQVDLTPGEQPAKYEVTVSNNTNDYADIQLQLQASYGKKQPKDYWYRVSPEVSKLIPQGDLTKFSLEIFDTPEPGFVGNLPITVEVFSSTIPNQPTRKLIKDLNIKPATSLKPVKIELSPDYLEKFPDTQEFNISVYIYNPNQQEIKAKIKLLNLDYSWIKDGISEYDLKLAPDEKGKQIFYLKLPNNYQIISKLYPFQVEVTHKNSPKDCIEGKIKILPQGSLNFVYKPEKIQEITAKPAWKFWRSDSVTYDLIFENNSNVYQDEVGINIVDQDQPLCTFLVTPKTSPLPPKDTKQLNLEVSCPRHWFGQAKYITPTIEATWSQEENLDLPNEVEQIPLLIKPIIPYWCQTGSVILLLCLFWWLLFKPPTRHNDAVNSVQFNGVGENIISASDDQTMINWRVSGFNIFKFWANPKIRQIGNTGKAVRLIRLRPVDNNFLAAGLENGEIQIWDLLSDNKKPKYCFSPGKDDRVLALEFSNDSHYLFSGHGSGLVRGWDLQNAPNCGSGNSTLYKLKPLTKQLNFAISSIKSIGKDQKILAIAGRYNQLILWNWAENKTNQISYPYPGGKDDYITTLATAESDPNLLATANTQGNITIFNVKDCLETNSKICGQVVDKWNSGQNEQPVRSISLTANACYLVSGGDDAKIRLWPLTKGGMRSLLLKNGNGKEIGNLSNGKTIYSLDIKIVQNDIVIGSGSKDHLVQISREKRLPEMGCDRD